MNTVKCDEPCPHSHRTGFHCRCLRPVSHRGDCVGDCGQAFTPTAWDWNWNEGAEP
jgi:hypothetical protein